MDQQPERRECETHREADEGDKGDPRFPSGPWRGYSLIPPKRHPHSMELQLTFGCNGMFTGTGRDLVGEFTIIGAYADDGRCTFEKRYMNGQVINYDGRHVNHGRYFGVSGDWVLEHWCERFWIEPVTDPLPP